MIRFVSIALTLLVFLTSGVFSQVAAPSERDRSQQPSLELDPRMQTARHLVRVKDYQSAAALLETLYENHPEHPLLITMLKNCYAELKLYGRAEALARKLVDQHPGDLRYRIDLAEAQGHLDMKDSARATYAAARALIPDGDMAGWSILILSEREHGFEHDALASIAAARAALRDSTAFALDRGTVLEARKQYREAVLEYFPLVSSDTVDLLGQADQAERRLLALLAFGESAREAERAVSELAGRAATGRRATSLLCDHFIRSGDYDQGFQYAVRLDSLDNHTGLPLANFMRQCLDRKTYDQVIKTGQYARSRNLGGPVATDLRFMHAEALTAVGNYTAAVAAYDTLATHALTEQDRTQALLALGELHAERLNDCRTALAYFDSVVARPTRGFAYLKAARARPLCYLRLGNIPSAQESWRQMQGTVVSEDLLEETLYYAGLIALFERRPDSTRFLFKKLTVEYPRGLYVNDALQIMMALDRVEQDSVLRDAYARMLWYRQRRIADSLLFGLTTLVESGNQALADLALFQRARLWLDKSDTVHAVADIDRLISGYAASYYIPFGLKLKAELLESSPDGRPKAREIYLQILEQHANSPLVGEVRKRLRALDGGA